MNAEDIVTQPVSEFLFRRFFDPMPPWAILLPVVFGLAVCVLVALFRRHNRLLGLAISSGIVLAVGLPYALLAFLLLPVVGGASWLLVLVPFLAVALVYVVLMYFRDSASIHPLWASFLGLLRCSVYAILALVFLLPGCQDWSTKETYSRVLVLVDVSGSMGWVDDVPRSGEDAALMPSRIDKVIQFLGKSGGPEGAKAKTFLSQLTDKTPVMVYRFGAVPDMNGEGVGGQRKKKVKAKDSDLIKEVVEELPRDLSLEELVNFLKIYKDGKPNTGGIKVPAEVPPEERAQYLRDRERLFEQMVAGTDIGGSALQIVQRELAGNRLQAIVIISDGQSNKGSLEAIRELHAVANNSKRPISIFTVGVGDYRAPVRVRLNPLSAPATVRPDDGGFPIRVPIFGDGLIGKEYTGLTLFAQHVNDKNGKEIKDGKVYTIGQPKKGLFVGQGEIGAAQEEFQVDLEAITGIKSKTDKEGELLGTWAFKVEVDKHPLEGLVKNNKHVSDRPTKVRVQKDKLRVLLVAGGPTRDYQFVRTMLFREVLEDRMDLSIYLQTASESEEIDQDVKGNRLLTRFPNSLEPPSKLPTEAEKFLTLKSYDVIIAFDPNWAAMDAEVLSNIKAWVGEHAGGLIFVCGSIYTDRFARPSGADIAKKLEPLATILPVTLADSSLEALTGKKKRDRSKPFALRFTGNSKSYDFLKLDEDKAEVPLSGWDDYFFAGQAAAGKQQEPKRGFFGYQPIERVRLNSEVIATIADPDVPRINDGQDEQPFMATMPYEKGRTFYIGANESWRLRLYKEAFHERFWVKLARFVSAGGKAASRSNIFMQPDYTTGTIKVDVLALDKDELPLHKDLKVEMKIKRPANFDPKIDTVTPEKVYLTARLKKGGKPFDGSFNGSFQVQTPGFYEISFDPANSGDPKVHRFEVKAPNPELDDLRTDWPALHALATPASGTLQSLDANVADKVRRALEVPRSGAPIAVKPGKDEERAEARLFLPLKSAGLITECIRKVEPDKESTKGKFHDLWDVGSKHVPTGAALAVLAGFCWLLGPICGLVFIIGLIMGKRWWMMLAAVPILGLLPFVVALACVIFMGPKFMETPLEGSLRADNAIMLGVLLIGLFTCGILAILRRWVLLAVIGGLAVFTCFVILVSNMVFEPKWEQMPIEMSVVLGLIVGLLAIEWLTRKLLKLA